MTIDSNDVKGLVEIGVTLLAVGALIFVGYDEYVVNQDSAQISFKWNKK